MTPLELLEQELEKYESALSKSTNALLDGKINYNKHEEHRINLKPKIAKYRAAIQVLITYSYTEQ